MQEVNLPKPALNLDMAISAVRSFSIATEVSVLLLSSEGEELFRLEQPKLSCAMCRQMYALASAPMPSACYMPHIYGAYETRIFGSSYIYFCPAGLMHFAVPIVIDAVYVASVIGGPVLTVEKDDFIQSDLLSRLGLNESFLPELRRIFLSAKPQNPAKISHLASTLSFAAQAIEAQCKVESDTPTHLSPTVEYDHSSYPLGMERELLSSIACGNRSAASKLLNQILGQIFFSSGGQFLLIRARVLELVVLLSRAALEGGANIEQIFGLNYKYLNEINRIYDVDELSQWLSRIITRFTDIVFNLVEVKHVDIIYKTIDFVDKNYARKITLSEVSSAVFLSPSYFSKIFKDEMHVNFNSYLNKVRVDKAKQKILSSSVDILTLGAEVGFEDQSYFCKVFKRYTGMTPSRYRECRGIIK